MIPPARCNQCGSDRYRLVHKTYRGDLSVTPVSELFAGSPPLPALRIVRCSDCDLVYAHPVPCDAALTLVHKAVSDGSYLEQEPGLRRSARRTLATLRRLVKGHRLLAVGHSIGFLLDEARAGRFKVHGIEFSAPAADHAKSVLGIDSVTHGPLRPASIPACTFDVILLSNIIEDLPDPKASLRLLRNHLKPDGVLWLNTPDVGSLLSKFLRSRWWGANPSHLYYFSRVTLKALLSSTGYVPTLVQSHPRTYNASYWARLCARYNHRLHRMFQWFVRNFGFENRLLSLNLRDHIELCARRARTLQDLDEIDTSTDTAARSPMRVVAVLPAYNAALTLKRTVSDISPEVVDEIILVDDASHDETVAIARGLGLTVFVHPANRGYGGNQKTCYEKALAARADIVVMVHPDYQYDPKAIVELIEPIRLGRADAVFGSRMMKGGALIGGMPAWKHNANILLTALENVVFRTFLTEYHSGFRAYSARLLRSVPYHLNSDGFVFDTEIIAQILLRGLKIEEIPIRTRYFDEASTIKLLPSIIYGLGILRVLLSYVLHTRTFIKFRQFS